jgi:hypothetical protein
MRNWEQPFLAALSVTGVLLTAANLANIDRVAVWRRRQSDPEFAKACEDAIKQAADALEEEARRRALEGAQEPVIYQGQPTYVYETDEAGYPIMDTVQEEQPGFDDKGAPIVRLVDVKRPRRKLDANGQPVILTVAKKSDALLALLLRGRRKEVFADRTELTGADAGPVTFADASKRQARLAALVKLAEARKALEDDEDFV